MPPPPFVTFVQLYPDAPAPRMADPTLAGSISLRAHRYCEPYTAASGLGWYVYPPRDFTLKSDGDVIYWKLEPDDPWIVLDHAAALPGFAEHCATHGADFGELGLPPFLGRSHEPNLVQLWFGLLAETPEGWSLLARPLANHPRDSRYEVLDGIVRTDWWFGPLVTPIRIRKTDEPIRFSRSTPFCQLQPVRNESFEDEARRSFDVRAMKDMSAADWQRVRDSLPALGEGGRRTAGSYKTRVRRRAGRGRDSG